MQTNSMDSYYDGIAERTKAILDRMQSYVALAIQNGDSIHQEKPGELVIHIRLPKESKDKK